MSLKFEIPCKREKRNTYYWLWTLIFRVTVNTRFAQKVTLHYLLKFCYATRRTSFWGEMQSRLVRQRCKNFVEFHWIVSEFHYETMNVPFECMSKCEAYVVIRFLTAQNVSTANIHKQLISIYDKNNICTSIGHLAQSSLFIGSLYLRTVDTVCKTSALTLHFHHKWQLNNDKFPSDEKCRSTRLSLTFHNLSMKLAIHYLRINNETNFSVKNCDSTKSIN